MPKSCSLEITVMVNWVFEMNLYTCDRRGRVVETEFRLILMNRCGEAGEKSKHS